MGVTIMAAKLAKTLEESKNIVNIKTNNEYEIISLDKEKSTFIHKSCGCCFQTKLKELLRSYKNNGGGCPSCANLKRIKNLSPKVTHDEFLIKFKEWDSDNEYSVINGTYIDNKTKIEVLHSICNKSYLVRPNDFQQGYRCPHCSAKNSFISNNEKDLFSFIKENVPSAKERVRDILTGMELDIYIPEMKLAIEYNGLYWHSEACGKDNKYHLNKLNACNEQGIRLIQVFEDEWLEHRKIVEEKLLHIMGISKGIRIGARKLLLVDVTDHPDTSELLEESHLQGKGQHCLAIGLEDSSGILLAVMTFCKLRKSLGRSHKDNCLELTRFAVKTGYVIPGAFSKIWNVFLKECQEIDTVITYADRRWSSGNLYSGIFTFIKNSLPSYWYTKKSNAIHRYHRYGFRKQVLKQKFPLVYSDEKTEKQIMDEAKYLRVWDCGNSVFEFHR
jgi:hypothetical protein